MKIFEFKTAWRLDCCKTATHKQRLVVRHALRAVVYVDFVSGAVLIFYPHLRAGILLLFCRMLRLNLG